MPLAIPTVGHQIKRPAKRNVIPAQFLFSVARYHEMIRTGVLTENDRVELINGRIVDKMPIYPPHRKAVVNLYDLLKPLFPANSLIMSQNPITLSSSEPEPDFSASEPPKSKYDTRNPGPDEVYLVVEVADSSLAFDSNEKLEMYAAAGIPVYWVVNLIDKRVEVYTKPKGGKKPGYGKVTKYKPGDDVPVMIAGKKRGTIAVSEILP
jgi:Uma2 family endonuclease